MTLTHSCNNAFADSASIFTNIESKWGGLSFVFPLSLPVVVYENA